MVDDPGYSDMQGRKCIHYAAASETTDNIEFLVKNSANFAEGDRMKITPLMISAMYNKVKTAEFLLTLGGNINVKSR